MVNGGDIRIAFALIASLAVHAMLLGGESGVPRDYSISSHAKKVTFHLVARQPEPVTQQVENAAKKQEPKVAREVVQPQHTPPAAEKPRQVLKSKPEQQLVPKPDKDKAPVRKEVQVVESSVREIEVPAKIIQPNPPEENPGIKEKEQDAEGVVMAVPLYRVNPPPHYPAKAKRRNLQGTVILAVTVSSQGKVEHLEVREGCGHRVLDRAALKAVRSWVFEPGRRNGLPVAMTVLVPVRFALH